MKKRSPEVKILIKILAIFGALVFLLLLAGYIFIRIQAPQLLEFSKGVAEIRATASLESLEDARFIAGMNGCENLLLEKDSTGVYVSCLDGYIHYLSPDQSGEFHLIKSFKAGKAVMGLAMSAQGDLFAAVSTVTLEEWFKTGAAINSVSRDLTSNKIITADYPCMNGISIDRKGDLYFTSDTFNLLSPKGLVYRMSAEEDGSFGTPVPYVTDAGAANGLYYDAFQDKIFLSNTLVGIYEFTPDNATLNEVYLKLRFMEACDDLCTDISGNIWMTDPGHSTVKMYNPGTNRLARFVIEGIGQTSSCRIRSENGREMLYITELKKSHQPVSDVFDGRGVLVVPAQSLLKQLEPLLIN